MKDIQPLVSIICIAYNHEKYISHALDGFVLQQTNFPFEVIVHDDASTDKTADVIRRYENRYPDLFKTIYQTENQYSKGKGHLERIIFGSASGKYIAFCEGDDYWVDPLKLQKQVDFLQSNLDYGLVWTDIDILNQSNGVIQKAVFRNGLLPIYDSFEETLINKPYFAPPTWVFRREFIPSTTETYCDGTFPMILDILAVTKIKHMDCVTAVYRQLPESVSHSKDIGKRYKFLNGVYIIQVDYADKYNVSDHVRDSVHRNYHAAALPYAVVLNDKIVEEKCLQSLEGQNKGAKTRLLIFLSGFKLGRSLIRFIYKNDSVKSIFQRLRIF